MNNFQTLNFKALLFAALATIPTLLLLQGVANSTSQAVTEQLARNQQSTQPVHLAPA